MLRVFLFLMALYVLYAADDVAQSLEVLDHEAVVQFQCNQQLHQVRWNTFCLSYSTTASIEEVLERNLLNGSEKDGWFVSDFELYEVLTDPCFGLLACLIREERVSYKNLSGHRLDKSHIAKMFASGWQKTWKVLSQQVCEGSLFQEGEVRIVFSGGVYRGVCGYDKGEIYELRPDLVLNAVGGGGDPPPLAFSGMRRYVDPTSLRCAQLMQEKQENFKKKLSGEASDEKVSLRKAALAKGSDVAIRYKAADGRKLGVVWETKDVCDKTGKPLLGFLQNCALQGTILGYTNERARRRFAFINEAIRTLLITTLASELESGGRVRSLKGASLLTRKELKATFPKFSWMFVPDGVCECPSQKNSLEISFSGGTILGMPRLDQSQFLQTSISSRSFLRGVSGDL